MTTTKKAGTYYKTVDGDTVDSIVYKAYGITAGLVEKVYQENPGLASYGPVLEAGVTIFIPEDIVTDLKSNSDFVDLWF